LTSKTRICVIFACLYLNIFLQPAICQAWEDFPKDRGNNYLDSYSDDDYQAADSSDDSADDFFKGGYYEDDATDYSAYSDDTYLSDGDDGESTNSDQSFAEVRPPMLEPGAPIKLEEKSIRLGRIPYRSLREMMTQAVPLLRLLQKKSGAKDVRLVSNRNDYASVIDALARGNIDFAWVGPAAYLSRRDKDHLMPVAKAKFGAATAYRGVFIAPAKGKVQGLEDLKGARIGFVDPESTSGYIYPLYLLLQLGINPFRDSQVFFLKNHDNVLRAVLAGKIDAGVCLDDTLNSIKDKTVLDKIIVLAKTNEIPSDVIVCRQDCPLNLREKFLEALLSVKANEIPGSPTFLQAFDQDFVEVEGIIKFIEAKKQGK
jgi:phosphonate transport system substrate-binding protein